MTQSYAKYPGYVEFDLVKDPKEKVGWDILDVIQSDDVEEHIEAVGVAQAIVSNSYTNGPSVMHGSRKLVVRRAMFLMGRKEATVVSGLKLQLQESQDRLDSVSRELSNTQHRYSSEKKEREILEDRLSSMTKSAEVQRTEMLKLKQTLMKFEADMAKLRRVLGEKAVKEALES